MPVLRLLALVLAPVLLLALAHPAAAQTGNQSDVSGPTATGSPTGSAPPGGAEPATPSTPQGRSALGSVSGSLEAGTTVDPGGGAISPEAQAAVAGALSEGASSPGGIQVRQSLEAALGGEVAAGGVVDALLEAIDRFGNAPSGETLGGLVDSLNALVNEASPEFLADPPEEFLAIHAAAAELRGQLG